MLPKDGSSLQLWQIYEQLLDPITHTIPKRYFLPLLTSQLLYCKLSQQPLSLAIVEIQNFNNTSKWRANLESDTLIKNIISTIKKNLRNGDALFYNKAQQFILLLPQVNKHAVKRLLGRIEDNLTDIHFDKEPLIIKAAFAASPEDTTSPITLEKCALEALDVAKQSTPLENRTIGYFTEHRNSTRIPLTVEVKYKLTGKKRHLVCSHNISESGINISGISDLPVGSNVELTFNIPGVKKTKIATTATPVWNEMNLANHTIDIGLSFTNLSKEVKEQINKFIQKSNQDNDDSDKGRLGKLNIISSALKKHKKNT